ncbi:hypothetical protein D3C71_1815210 [compost metagenome]
MEMPAQTPELLVLPIRLGLRRLAYQNHEQNQQRQCNDIHDGREPVRTCHHSKYGHWNEHGQGDLRQIFCQIAFQLLDAFIESGKQLAAPFAFCVLRPELG